MKRSFPAEPARAEAPIPVMIYGLGAIGLENAKLALSKRSLRVVSASDADPQKLGKDLAELLGLPDPLGIQVTREPAAGAAVAIHSTRSFLPEVMGQLQELISLGINVVSSTEELSFPTLRYRKEAAELDGLARAQGVRVLGTGVNPGFVMDTLPLLATGLCQEASHLTIERVVDASQRRYNLQKKIGAGMTVAEFEAAMEEGRMGHVGLVESLAMVASGLGWELDRIEEEILPVVAEDSLRSAFFQIAPGKVAGLHQVAKGYRAGVEAIVLCLEMALGAPDPRDRAIIAGYPPLHLELPGGVMGDAATAAVLVNSVPRLLETPPGLKTMLDLPLPRLIP